jgi:hypothetical protein
MKRKVKRFDEGGYAALLADAQAADREREGLPSMDDSTSNDKGYSGSEAIQDESGTVSKLRRNTETGDLYNPEGNFPSKSTQTRTKPVATSTTRNTKPAEDSESGVGVGAAGIPSRGMRTRTEEEKARGAKTLEEGLPSAIPIGRGLKYAKGALDELRTVNAAKQLAGPSSQKLLSGPSSTKLLSGPASETKLLTSNVSKASAENSPAIEQAMTGRSMSSGAIKRQSERDRIAALRERRGITQGPRNMGYKSGGSVSSASSRGDGIAQRGKTRGKVC